MKTKADSQSSDPLRVFPQQGSFLHEHARPLNKRCAWSGLTTGSAFIKMVRLKAIIAIILLVGLGECARDLTKFVPWVPEDIFSYRY